jgi:hypothetical protein
MSTTTPSPTNTVFGRGAIFFDRFSAAGVRSGQFQHLGNCDNLATSVSSDVVDLTDYTQNTSAPYNTAIKSTDVELKISGFEFAPSILAPVFMGDTSTFTQSAVTVTTETIAAATLTGLKGSYFKAANRNVSAATMLQGTVTLVSGTDWEIANAYTGLFRVKPTSSTVADGTALKVNYTAAALTAGTTALETIRIFNQSNIYGQLLFVPNNSSGPNLELVAWYVSMRPDGDVSLISDDWAKWNMSGKILSDASGAYGGSANEPYGRITKQS